MSRVIKKPFNWDKRKHGMDGTKIYEKWKNMKRRCVSDNPKYKPWYKDKGITVCEKWQKFEGFFEDMGMPPDGSPSLDRIDNSKGYYKENCRWVPYSIQIINRAKRMNASSQFRGVTKKGEKFAATIRKGKLIHIGYFDNEIEAAKAYNKKALELYGELACLNQID